VPHSVFTGRTVGDGEPLFTAEDTDAAVALAEEEADTCPQCGMPKVWCRDAKNHQFSFEGVASTCWATEAQKVFEKTDGYKKLKDSVREATYVSARFRDGREPDLLAGLDVGEG
jgi:hypothetical protein